MIFLICLYLSEYQLYHNETLSFGFSIVYYQALTIFPSTRLNWFRSVGVDFLNRKLSRERRGSAFSHPSPFFRQKPSQGILTVMPSQTSNHATRPVHPKSPVTWVPLRHPDRSAERHSTTPYSTARLRHHCSSTTHESRPQVDLSSFPPPQLPSRGSFVSSLPATPYKELSHTQMKKLKSIKETETQVSLIKDTIDRLNGAETNHENVTAALATVLDFKPRRRTFSLLTKSDYRILNPALQGEIVVNAAALAEQKLFIPDRFWEELYRCRSLLDRSMEQGCRSITVRFFEWAILLAREKFDIPRLVLFQQEEVPTTEIPGIGEVHGPLDFVTGTAAGTANMGKTKLMNRADLSLDLLMHSGDATNVRLSSRGFVAVEAKRQEIMDPDSKKAQLLAQIKALQIQT
jgi:hypothetical protein